MIVKVLNTVVLMNLTEVHGFFIVSTILKHESCLILFKKIKVCKHKTVRNNFFL